MNTFEVWGICSADDKTFNSEKEAVKYAECLGDDCEALWEVTDDYSRVCEMRITCGVEKIKGVDKWRILRDDLL